MDLSQKNALYTEAETLRIRSRDLYGGSHVVKQKGTTYLFQGKNETDENYQIRLKRAVIDNYVEKIVRARQSVLFMRPQTRDLDAKLEELRSDVDTKGTSASTFFRDISECAQVDGLVWVLVDMPRAVVESKSAAEERAAGIRPFMQVVPASSVLDWEVGSDNDLNWAVIAQYGVKPRNPGDAVEKVQQYKIWFRDHWELHQIGEVRATEAGSTTKIDEGSNPTGRVPLVPFYGIKSADYLGLPVCYSVLDHVVLAYNKNSDLDWFEQLSCHPIPYVVSPKEFQKLDVGGGMWIESGPQTGAIEVNYLQTSGAGETSVRDSIDRIEARIYAIALAQAKRDGKQVQAADSQREDRRSFTSSLKSVSEQLETSERQCWDLAAEWLGAPKLKREISYNRDFDDRTIDDAMLASLVDMVDGKKLSLETLLETLEYADILPGFDAAEEKKRLAKETATRAVDLVGDLKTADGGA